MDTEQKKYFARRKPLPDYSSLIVATDGETLAISLYKGGTEPAEEIAWSAPGAKKEDVIWLAMSAAAFHNISCAIDKDVAKVRETL